MPNTSWDKKWLIWCHERDMWWKPNRQGYTFYLNEAGHYSYMDACEIVKEANQYSTDAPQESMMEADSMLGKEKI
jgi:hypothetical protein